MAPAHSENCESTCTLLTVVSCTGVVEGHAGPGCDCGVGHGGCGASGDSGTSAGGRVPIFFLKMLALACRCDYLRSLTTAAANSLGFPSTSSTLKDLSV